jgi:hypothetical protein
VRWRRVRSPSNAATLPVFHGTMSKYVLSGYRRRSRRVSYGASMLEQAEGADDIWCISASHHLRLPMFVSCIIGGI